MNEPAGEVAAETTQPGRRRRWGVVLAGAVLLAGVVFFVRQQSFHARAAKLRVGMTTEEVFALVGQPDYEIGLGKTRLAVFTPLPFPLHVFVMSLGEVIRRAPALPATGFPACVEFEEDRAVRVIVNGLEIDAVKK